MSNILLKILIVVALILTWMVYYSNKIIHEKPIHEKSVVVTSVVMPHPPLSDKRGKQEESKVEEDTQIESNQSETYVEDSELNRSSIALTPNVPKAEVEVIISDDSLDKPAVIIINDETEIIEDNNRLEEILPIEEPPLVHSDEVEVIEETPHEQIPIEQPNNDLGRRIGGDDEKKENVDLGVQLF